MVALSRSILHGLVLRQSIRFCIPSRQSYGVTILEDSEQVDGEIWGASAQSSALPALLQQNYLGPQLSLYNIVPSFVSPKQHQELLAPAAPPVFPAKPSPCSWI